MGIIKKLKVFGLMTLVACGVVTMTGCGSELKNAQEELNGTMKNKINASELLDSKSLTEIDKFVFLGADFEKENNYYTVNLNGIASYGDKQKAYVNSGLKVDESYFVEINEETSTAEVLKVLNTAINENELEYLDIIPVSNLNELSNSVVRSQESPLEDFKFNKGMLYAVSAPQFNEEEGTVMFQTKSYVKYSKTESEITFGFTGVDSEGKPKYGTVVRTKTYYDQFTHLNNIYIKASEQEIEDMKQDNTKVYSKFVDYYKNEQKSNYVIQSVSVEKDQEFNTNMFEDTSLDMD